MQEGILMFDQQADRVDIRFDNGDYYGGLHCGTPVEVWLNGQSTTTRISTRSGASACARPHRRIKPDTAVPFPPMPIGSFAMRYIPSWSMPPDVAGNWPLTRESSPASRWRTMPWKREKPASPLWNCWTELRPAPAGLLQRAVRRSVCWRRGTAIGRSANCLVCLSTTLPHG